MKENTVRTTIVLPRETLRRAKIQCALADKSLSRLIAEALERSLDSPQADDPPALPIGKYRFGIGKFPRRKEMYAEALRPELPA